MANKNYVYYYSDPEGTTRNQRYHVFVTDVELDTIPWHFHTEKPSEDLKAPVWSKETNGWIEDDKKSNAAQLASVSDMVEQLQKDHEESVAQADKLVQANQQSQAMMQQFQQQSIMNGQMLGQLNASIAEIQKSLSGKKEEGAE